MSLFIMDPTEAASPPPTPLIDEQLFRLRSQTQLPSRSTLRASITDSIRRHRPLGKDYSMIVLNEGKPVQTGIIADFVLVHGLTGDYLNTWTVKGTRTEEEYCWPQALLPGLYPNLRVMSFSYDADVTHMCGGSHVAEGNVLEYADTLLAWLRARRPDKSPEQDRPLIFFGHSLGGLVLERALLIASKGEAEWLFKLFHATVAVFVFGTPHYGSRFASLAVPLARFIRPFHFVNTDVLSDLLPAAIPKTKGKAVEESQGQESRWQDELIDHLRRRKADNDPILFFCGFEQLGRRWVPHLHRVVPARSAVLSHDHSLVEQCGFHVTHTDLVRFKGLHDRSFEIFDSHLRPLLNHLPSRLSLAEQSSNTTPAPNPELGRFIRRIDVLPKMVKTFIGRETPLQEIFEALKAWARDRPAVVVLTGNGGRGKSQIALEYARRRFDDRTYDAVFWADASSEHAAKLSFAQIWDAIKPNTGLAAEEKYDKACQALLNMTIRWLLVLDNFDRSVLDGDELPETTIGEDRQQSEQEERPKAARRGSPDCETEVRNSYINNFIPRNDFGHVIITTRDRRVRHLGSFVKVPLMTQDEAVLMLKTRLCSRRDNAAVEWNEEEAATIVEEIGCLPLAIEQVASHILSSQSSLNTFLNTYRKCHRDIFSRVPEESNLRISRVRQGTSYVKKSLGVLEVWEMSFEAIERHSNKRIRDVALAILTAAGFLDRTGISIKFLTKLEVAPRSLIHWTALGRDDMTLLELDKATRLLDSWSVIEGYECDQDQDQVEKITVHPLIQDWIRLRMGKSDLLKEALQVIRLIERNLAQDHDRLLATSVESKYEISRHISAARNLLESDRPEFEPLKALQLGNDILSEATITFASFYYDFGDLAKATELFDLVRDNHRGANQDTDPLFLQSEEGLGLVRLWKEDGDGAFALLDHAVRGYKILPKEYHRPLYRAIHNLGEVECFRKNFDAAIELFQTSLKGFTAEFGHRSKEVYREKEALGNAYRAKGMVNEALTEVSEAHQGLFHVDPNGDATINATESLALVMKAKRNFPRAEELYHQVIAVYERSVGKSQYTTIGAMGGLADAYRKSGQLDEAKKVYAEIMKRLSSTMSTGEAQYKRAKEAYENLTSKNPDVGPLDDFSYPWPRAVAELQTQPHGSR